MPVGAGEDVPLGLRPALSSSLGFQPLQQVCASDLRPADTFRFFACVRWHCVVAGVKRLGASGSGWLEYLWTAPLKVNPNPHGM